MTPSTGSDTEGVGIIFDDLNIVEPADCASSTPYKLIGKLKQWEELKGSIFGELDLVEPSNCASSTPEKLQGFLKQWADMKRSIMMHLELPEPELDPKHGYGQAGSFLLQQNCSIIFCQCSMDRMRLREESRHRPTIAARGYECICKSAASLKYEKLVMRKMAEIQKDGLQSLGWWYTASDVASLKSLTALELAVQAIDESHLALSADPGVVGRGDTASFKRAAPRYKRTKTDIAFKGTMSAWRAYKVKMLAKHGEVLATLKNAVASAPGKEESRQPAKKIGHTDCVRAEILTILVASGSDCIRGIWRNNVLLDTRLDVIMELYNSLQPNGYDRKWTALSLERHILMAAPTEKVYKDYVKRRAVRLCATTSGILENIIYRKILNAVLSGENSIRRFVEATSPEAVDGTFNDKPASTVHGTVAHRTHPWLAHHRWNTPNEDYLIVWTKDFIDSAKRQEHVDGPSLYDVLNVWKWFLINQDVALDGCTSSSLHPRDEETLMRIFRWAVQCDIQTLQSALTTSGIVFPMHAMCRPDSKWPERVISQVHSILQIVNGYLVCWQPDRFSLGFTEVQKPARQNTPGGFGTKTTSNMPARVSQEPRLSTSASVRPSWTLQPSLLDTTSLSHPPDLQKTQQSPAHDSFDAIQSVPVSHGASGTRPAVGNTQTYEPYNSAQLCITAMPLTAEHCIGADVTDTSTLAGEGLCSISHQVDEYPRNRKRWPRAPVTRAHKPPTSDDHSRWQMAQEARGQCGVASVKAPRADAPLWSRQTLNRENLASLTASPAGARIDLTTRPEQCHHYVSLPPLASHDGRLGGPSPLASCPSYDVPASTASAVRDPHQTAQEYQRPVIAYSTPPIASSMLPPCQYPQASHTPQLDVSPSTAIFFHLQSIHKEGPVRSGCILVHPGTAKPEFRTLRAIDLPS